MVLGIFYRSSNNTKVQGCSKMSEMNKCILYYLNYIIFVYYITYHIKIKQNTKEKMLIVVLGVDHKILN